MEKTVVRDSAETRRIQLQKHTRKTAWSAEMQMCLQFYQNYGLIVQDDGDNYPYSSNGFLDQQPTNTETGNALQLSAVRKRESV